MANTVIFTTDPSKFTKLEALYVVEKDPPGFIAGRDISRPLFITKTLRGPLTPQLITSAARAVEVYGPRDLLSGEGPVANELWRALVGKQFGPFYVLRAAAAAAATSSINAETGIDGAGTEVLKIAATSPGIWGRSVKWKIEAATDGDANHFNLRVRFLGDEVAYENLNISSTSDNLAAVVGEDVGNWVVLTKLAAGRPNNSSTVTQVDFVAARDTDGFVFLQDIGAAYTGVDGADGTLAASDYTALLDDASAVQGASIVLAPESLEDTCTAGAQATFNTAIVAQAALTYDRIFLTWSGKTTQSASTEITNLDAQITTKSDRIVWCFNAGKVLDPATALKMYSGPHVFLASILNQNDVDIHPGSSQTAPQLAGIVELQNETITNGDLETLRAAGISTLEKLPDQFQFRSGVVTLKTAGKTEITRRRMADFLQLSASDRLKDFVKDRGTVENRAQIKGELTAFSQELKDLPRIVENYSVDQEGVNTAAMRARGVEKIAWRVNLIDHMLAIVLETEIGTGVVIESQA